MNQEQQCRAAVPTPFRQRLRTARQRALPALVWLAAVGLVIALMARRSYQTDAVGLVELRQATVAPLFDGTVQAMSVDLFDEVQPGQALAVMDDTLIQAELAIAKAELAQLRGELEAREQELRLDGVAAERRFLFDAEMARLDYLVHVTDHEADVAAMRRLETMCNLQDNAADAELLRRTTSDETRLRYETLRQRVTNDEAALDAARSRLDQTEQRRAAFAELYGNEDWSRVLEPFRQEIRAQENCLSEIAQRGQSLVLRAPLAGKVSIIFYRTGETVLAGTPVLAITSPESQRVVAYIPERSLRAVQVGTPAEIRSRRPAAPAARGTVLRVGSKVEEMPLALWRNPTITERGFSVLVGNIPAGRFLPGEALDLRFLTDAESF